MVRIGFTTQDDIDRFIAAVIALADARCWETTGRTLAEATDDTSDDWKWRVLGCIRQWYGYAASDVAINVLWLCAAHDEAAVA
jgi:hypothetical protein